MRNTAVDAGFEPPAQLLGSKPANMQHALAGAPLSVAIDSFRRSARVWLVQVRAADRAALSQLCAFAHMLVSMPTADSGVARPDPSMLRGYLFLLGWDLYFASLSRYGRCVGILLSSALSGLPSSWTQGPALVEGRARISCFSFRARVSLVRGGPHRFSVT